VDESASPRPRLVDDSDAKDELIERWMLHMKMRGQSLKTITERSAVVRRLAAPVTLSPDDIDRFLNRADWSVGTRATYHGAIRAWSRWLVLTGERSDDPTLIASTPKVPKGRPRPLSDGQLSRLLAAQRRTRIRDMIALGAYAGLRVSEIAAVRGERVNLDGGVITVTGKGNKTRDIPLHPILLEIADHHPRRGWWFPSYTGNRVSSAGGPVLGNSVSDSISKAMNRVGLDTLTPHCLRHWFATALRATGVDALVLRDLMGHESLTSTAIYTDIPLAQRAAAVRRLPRLADTSFRTPDLAVGELRDVRHRLAPDDTSWRLF